MATDRRTPVRSTLLRREFLSPATLHQLDMNDRSQEAIDAWVEAPWFHASAVVAEDVTERYADGEGRLSCGVSLRTLETFSWTQHF